MPSRSCRLSVVAAVAVASFGATVPAQAFCGFFVAGSNARLTNHASQAVLLRQGNRTTLTLSNDYQGPPESFALVVPVPVVLQKDDVKTLEPTLFDKLDTLSAPRLVEYWEQDPCYRPPPGAEMDDLLDAGHGRASASHGVTVEAQFAVGEYEIVVLGAQDSAGLETWLKQNHYNIPPGAATALAPYVRDQMKFFVAKVDIHKVHRDEHGTVVLSPLRFGYPSNDLRLPVRLGLLNAPTASGQKQDLIVYLLHAASRFEVANLTNIFIPTNLDVSDEVRGHFASFYGQLFDAAVAKVGGKAAVTEYAWASNSCDPCPSPPLTPEDLLILGAESTQPPPGVSPAHGQQSRRWAPRDSWVLTRIHLRYDRATLAEDLVFREAAAIVGGREEVIPHPPSLTEPERAESNSFQGRYIIRHPWVGQVHCAQPLWNQWGEPPDGKARVQAGKHLDRTRTKTDTKMDLRRVVRTAFAPLQLPGHAAPRHGKSP